MSLGDGVLTLQLDSSGVTGLSTDLEFEIHILKDKTDSKSRSGTTIPTDRPENNVIFSIGGSEKVIRGTAKLYDVNDDVSNGTLQAELNETDSYRSLETDSRFSSGTVTTAKEQKIWLDEYVNNDNLNAEWTLYGLEFTEWGGTSGGLNIFAAEITPRETPQEPLAITLDFRLLVGQRI